MAAIEVQFPRDISYGTSVGPRYNVSKVMVESGARHKNKVWSEPLRRWDVAHAVRTQAQFDTFQGFVYALAEGPANAFRFWDPSDYLVTVANGRLAAIGQTGTFSAAAVGNGTPFYQLAKRYTYGAYSKDREITKPGLASTNTIYRNASPVTYGVAAGNCALDTATGRVTFVATDSEAITGHTPGASHVFTTAADIPGLAIGEKVYLTGVTGTAATALNNLAHTISNKTGAGPYTWTISTATTGLTASGGTAFEYPQATDALTWAGEFDNPAEFVSMEFRYRIVNRADGLLYEYDAIPIQEVRAE
jgi:uncharacterized protein (TIGR02217 family)